MFNYEIITQNKQMDPVGYTHIFAQTYSHRLNKEGIRRGKFGNRRKGQERAKVMQCVLINIYKINFK